MLSPAGRGVDIVEVAEEPSAQSCTVFAHRWVRIARTRCRCSSTGSVSAVSITRFIPAVSNGLQSNA